MRDAKKSIKKAKGEEPRDGNLRRRNPMYLKRILIYDSYRFHSCWVFQKIDENF